MKLISSVVLAGFGTFFTATLANAETLSYAGLSYNYMTGTNDPGDDTGTATGVTLDAGVVYGLNSMSRIVVEGTYTQWTDDDAGDLFSNTPGSEVEIAAHYLRDAMGGKLTYGGFLSYGSAEAEANQADETYTHFAYGLEATYRINSQFMAYGQIAKVSAPNVDATDSAGYDDGMAYRIGGIYTGFRNTALFLDYQKGDSARYEDNDEPGEFERITIGGESLIGGGPFAVTYEVSQDMYDALNDSDRVDVTTAALGVRYYFGGKQGADLRNAGAIGTPIIIGRASLFTDSLD